jgi:xanthine dehydrogenase accessory factor
MLNIFIEIERLLASGEKLVLARIIRQTGSAPRSTGTKQLIRPDGAIVGTIGGGRLEYEVLQKAAEVRASGRSALLHVRMTGRDAAESEMLCGGLVDVFLEPVDPGDPGVRAVFQDAARMAVQGSRGVLLTHVCEGVSAVGRMLVGSDGQVRSAQHMPPADFSPEACAKERRPRLTAGDESAGAPRFFIEPLEPESVLYLFGAGHVSTCVAPLARMAGFKVAVIDDRAEFASAERFPSADELLVCPIEEAFRRIQVSPAAYIVIVTRGHLHDRQALQAALGTRPAYIGMIGSRRKRDLIYRSLKEDGVPEDRLRQVHSPIGLPIGAETPEEIGISIVAELIQVRAALQAEENAAVPPRP